jgi:hypothetical protein
LVILLQVGSVTLGFVTFKKEFDLTSGKSGKPEVKFSNLGKHLTPGNKWRILR